MLLILFWGAFGESPYIIILKIILKVVEFAGFKKTKPRFLSGFCGPTWTGAKCLGGDMVVRLSLFFIFELGSFYGEFPVIDN